MSQTFTKCIETFAKYFIDIMVIFRTAKPRSFLVEVQEISNCGPPHELIYAIFNEYYSFMKCLRSFP